MRVAAAVVLVLLVLAGCGSSKTVTKTVSTPAQATTSGATSSSSPTSAAVTVPALTACLDKVGANAKTDSQRPPDDNANYQPLVHAPGYIDSLDPWRAQGTGFYLWIYDTPAHAAAAIKAQQRSDTQHGYAGLNGDLLSLKNVVAGPQTDGPSDAHSHQLAACLGT